MRVLDLLPAFRDYVSCIAQAVVYDVTDHDDDEIRLQWDGGRMG